MKLNLKSVLPGVTRFAVTAAFATALVFGVIWGLTQWAKYEPPIEPDPSGTITLTSSKAKTHGPPQIKHESHAGEINIGYWDYDTQWISWEIDIPQSGNYTVDLRYARPGKSSVELMLEIGDNSLTASAPGTGGWGKWQNEQLGTIQLTQGKKLTITLKAKNPPSEGVINFVHLKLTPIP